MQRTLLNHDHFIVESCVFPSEALNSPNTSMRTRMGIGRSAVQLARWLRKTFSECHAFGPHDIICSVPVRTGDVMRGFLLRPYPQYDWDFPEEIPEKIGKTPETPSEPFLEFPSRVRLGSPKPYISRLLKPPMRLGTPEVVPKRASQSWSWNSHQY